AAARAVHDHALETSEQVAPAVAVAGRPARQKVVRGEDGTRSQPQQRAVDTGPGEPLQVHDVGPKPGKLRHAKRMLEGLQRQPQRRAPERARAQGIEELPPRVAGGRRGLAEAEARGDKLDLSACAREACSEL